jgi:hypothetical protein
MPSSKAKPMFNSWKSEVFTNLAIPSFPPISSSEIPKPDTQSILKLEIVLVVTVIAAVVAAVCSSSKNHPVGNPEEGEYPQLEAWKPLASNN